MVRLAKFGTVGASGAVVGLGLLYALTDLAGWHYLISYIVAFIASVSNNYLWNSLWTFRGREAHIVGFGKYMVVSATTLCINLALVYFATDILGLWYMLSAVIVTAFVFLLNFTLSKRYVWKRSNIKQVSE